MGLRPARCIREPKKRAWTRFSQKKPRKSYIKAMPHKDLNVYRMGATKPDFNYTVSLVVDQDIVLRDNSIESARQSANKELETKAAGNYFFLVRVYPHQVLRENKMVAGAGADRIQKGMRQAFGKPVDRAARLRKGQALFTVSTYKANEAFVQRAFKKATMKLSGRFRVVPEVGA
ncbi:50S ribosomal protein L16 [Candidatus Micrarchaeota archaeon]|nr:50S ribosomal protein L16 [Candidatus Micrarchaeota archaeon]